MRLAPARLLTLLIVALSLNGLAAAAEPARLLVEAESFNQHGGWKLDTQFIHIMGSPYMLAHGLGRPVDDATTTVQFPQAGTYRVFVRTKDWVARWGAEGTPGKFQLLVNGKPLDTVFGTKGAEWHWHDGGTVEIKDKAVKLALHDLTGFDGRADAIYFTTDLQGTPPPNSMILPAWRRDLLGLKAEPTPQGPFDLVVVGGGYSGMGAAISAARMGLKVALIQERPVLGGNGSSEVRVWAKGLIRRGRYPTVGQIIEEFADSAKNSPGTYEEFGDAKKEAVVRAEPNIALFLNHHAYEVKKDGDQIKSVIGFDTRTSEWKEFTGKFFVDATGHGTIGALAGADFDMTMEKHMGMSNMWKVEEAEEAIEFPETPWALNLEMGDFPYPRHGKGEWFWETGFDKHPINDLELMRDWNLRAVFGAFSAMKHGAEKAKHCNTQMVWLAYIGGPRESRRLLGDVILTRDDIVAKRDFPDGCVATTWSIDLHYAKQQFAKKYPDDPFISYAAFDRSVDRNYGYPVPYRTFYSRNVPNLFMAGRCISVTHEALGTVRVMKTCGMMGEVVGKAASLCIKHDTTPRGVYQNYWNEMDKLLKLPGATRRNTVNGEFYVRDDAYELQEVEYISTPVKKVPGICIDDEKATKTGKWTAGEGLKGFIGYHYLYSPANSDSAARFDVKVPESGRYEVRIATQPHANRSTKTPVTVESADGSKTVRINQRVKPDKELGFVSVGVYRFDAGKPGAVTIATDGADGTVHADAVQLLPVK